MYTLYTDYYGYLSTCKREYTPLIPHRVLARSQVRKSGPNRCVSACVCVYCVRACDKFSQLQRARANQPPFMRTPLSAALTHQSRAVWLHYAATATEQSDCRLSARTLLFKCMCVCVRAIALLLAVISSVRARAILNILSPDLDTCTHTCGAAERIVVIIYAYVK